MARLAKIARPSTSAPSEVICPVSDMAYHLREGPTHYGLAAMTQRLTVLCSFVALLGAGTVAQAQESRTAAAAAERPISISASVAWIRDMTYYNEVMPGGAASVALPIGVGQWIVIEGALYRQSYHHRENASASIARGSLSVAVRLGSPSHRGVFVQLGAGLSAQRFDALGGGSSYYYNFKMDNPLVTLMPAIGFDLGLGGRMSVQTLAGAQLVLRYSHDHWFNPQVTTGLAVAIGSR